jgi:hypothetical protein
VVALILEATAGGASTLIVDAEIVAVDREDGNRLRAFQVGGRHPCMHLDGTHNITNCATLIDLLTNSSTV